MNTLLNKSIVLTSLLFLATAIHAEDTQLSKAIQEQVSSADDCEVMAYAVELKNTDADESFKECVERRAILIGMQKRYGPGKYGEIDVFDKIEGYSHLANSNNDRVKEEASSFATAAGFEELVEDIADESVEEKLEELK